MDMEQVLDVVVGIILASLIPNTLERLYRFFLSLCRILWRIVSFVPKTIHQDYFETPFPKIVYIEETPIREFFKRYKRYLHSGICEPSEMSKRRIKDLWNKAELDGTLDKIKKIYPYGYHK